MSILHRYVVTEQLYAKVVLRNMFEDVNHYSNSQKPLQNVLRYRLVVILFPLMNLVDVETEWKFPIPPPPPPPPNEEEENEVKPPPPIGPNGVKPTEMTMMMMMMMMFKYTSMPNIPRRTSCQCFFISFTQINKPASNPEKGDPNGENPGKNEPVVLLLLTPL